MSEPGWFDQHGFASRFDWGADGLARLAPVSDVVVTVDVLRFSTAVEVAVARGAVVLPYRWKDGDAAAAYAAEHDAELAGWREDSATPWSLSPTDLAAIPAGTRLVLPSPNGSALAFAAAAPGQRTAAVLAGCLRNASAVAAYAASVAGSGPTVAVIAAAEQHRPAVEDLLGAGAVLAGLDRSNASPEARAAVAAYEAAADDLPGWLAASASGRELVDRGWGDDVAMAAELDVSAAVPQLMGPAFVDAGTLL